MQYILSCIKDKYCCFTGRARRKEYWMFFLFQMLISFAAQVLDFLLATGLVVSVIASLALLLPGLGVTTRRLHDTDKSGWMILIAFIPFIGGIILLVFMCLEGNRGDNRYGPDPKAFDPE